MVESSEKLVMQLFFSLIFVVFRFSCSVSHISKWTKGIAQLEAIKETGKQTLQTVVGIVMSEDTLPGFLKAANLKISEESLATDHKTLLKYLSTELNPDVARALVHLISTVAFLKSFIMKSDITDLKTRPDLSSDTSTQEVTKLVHCRIKGKYAKGLHSFAHMLNSLQSLLTSEETAFAAMNIPRNVMAKASQELSIQSSPYKYSEQTSNIVRLAMAISLEKVLSSKGTNERLKTEFETFVNKYKIITQKASSPKQLFPPKLDISTATEFKPRAKTPPKPLQVAKQRKLPKYLHPLEKLSQREELKEARSLRLDLASIKRKERELQQPLSTSRGMKSPRSEDQLTTRSTMKSPRRLEPLTSQLSNK
jgi:hypothetical protein